MKIKKSLKILLILIVFITLPSILLFSYAYFKYNEKLPQGVTGIEADALAAKMQNTLNIQAYEDTKYIEFTSRNKRHYELNLSTNICTLYWKDFKVELNLKTHDSSSAYIHSFKVTGDQKEELSEKALKYYNKDIFWLNAPYRAFDTGIERMLVTLEDNTKALLIKHPKDDDVPVKSYLWILDGDGKPTAFKMWDKSLPIDGLEASWSDWITTDSGAQLPTFHKILIFGIEIENIVGIP